MRKEAVWSILNMTLPGTRRSLSKRLFIFVVSPANAVLIDEVSKDQTRILADILNNRGSKGWELVQISFGKDGVIAFWKRRIKDKKK